MLSQIRDSIFSRILWGFLGLYLLNISVDAEDPYPEHISENLAFNDQESILEIVVEKILKYENAIKEYDDHDPEGHNKKASVKIDLTNHSTPDSSLNQSFLEKIKQKFPEYDFNLTSGFHKLDIPPPKI